jgi:NAD-dependent dihydropyrimidine dehydrogenase PreA subunit
MKTTIYYFTGTGNSLKMARDLAQRLDSTELIPIAGLVDSASVSASADRVGIVCPVYMWGLPLIVQDFAKKLMVDTGSYLFGIVTYGGFPAATLKQLNRLLNQSGLRLSAGYGIHMPGNYTPMYGAFSKEKQEKLFSKGRKRLESIAEIIRAGKVARVESSFFLANLLFSKLIYQACSPKITYMDKGFWVNEKCDSCGICAKVCPVYNIEMKEGKPEWQHHCQQCLACLHWCPLEAIEFGKKTPGRKRYRHPEIQVSDIVGQSLSA